MAMAPDRSLSLVHTTDHYADDEDDTYHSPHHSTDIEGRPVESEKKEIGVIIWSNSYIL